MDRGTKDIIQALVESHWKHSAVDTIEFDDIVSAALVTIDRAFNSCPIRHTQSA